MLAVSCVTLLPIEQTIIKHTGFKRAVSFHGISAGATFNLVDNAHIRAAFLDCSNNLLLLHKCGSKKLSASRLAAVHQNY